MIVVILRALIMYIVVLFSLRIMGKGQLGELEPFDFVISLMIAELAAMPITDLNSPISHGITAIITLMFLQCITSFTSIKNIKLRRIVTGTPKVLISHGKINYKEMKSMRININDILGQIRLKGYTNIDDIDYMIMENNGEISIIADETLKSKKCKRLPIAIIEDGYLMKENIQKYSIPKSKIETALKSNKLIVRKVVYGYVDENDKCIFIRKD